MRYSSSVNPIGAKHEADKKGPRGEEMVIQGRRVNWIRLCVLGDVSFGRRHREG
jgi:hypothetical protein